MKITSNHCRLEGSSTSDKKYAFLDSQTALHGYGVGVCLFTGIGNYYLCHKKGDQYRIYIIGIPSEEWLQDLKDDGYEIIQELKREVPL